MKLIKLISAIIFMFFTIHLQAQVSGNYKNQFEASSKKNQSFVQTNNVDVKAIAQISYKNQSHTIKHLAQISSSEVCSIYNEKCAAISHIGDYKHPNSNIVSQHCTLEYCAHEIPLKCCKI
ncbi:hypothetical protein [Cytophaga aurantiaca]|uniref:hypothetical protein n=1 Tax=Cytophaga aurantiaca TaxID=29530 RepID=UPI00036C3B8A|nr:hypothetical protein [Cytophaga aurantiaca]